RQSPFGHYHCRARRLNRGILRLDLPLATEGGPHLRERRLQGCDLCRRGTVVGAPLIQRLPRHSAGTDQALGTIEIRLGAFARGAGVREIRLRLLYLGWLAGRFEVAELLLSLSQEASCLITGSAVGRLVLGEEGCARCDLIASGDADFGQQTLLR